MSKLDDIIGQGGTFVATDGTRVHITTPHDIAQALDLAIKQGGVWTSSPTAKHPKGVETKIEKDPQ